MPLFLLTALACGGAAVPYYDGALVAADLWTEQPEILSAGLGFDGILGVPGRLDEDAVREVGGSWYGSLRCGNGEEPTTGMRSSVVPRAPLNAAFLGTATRGDGLPVVFSWPIVTSSIRLEDLRFTLNNGEVVVPEAAGMTPNYELNERNTLVVVADFGNRLSAGDPDARFPVRLDVAEDATLLLRGPDGDVSAAGLSWTTDGTPYDSGPRLVGAKLNRVGAQAEGEGVYGDPPAGIFPNDEQALYGGGDFRLRVLTSGGFSPDGVTGLRPDRFEDFFRIHATGPDGEPTLLTEVGVDYSLAGGSLRVLGLAELGQAEDESAGVFYDDCYLEDQDNQIDIVLVGDEEAARGVTAVEIPALEGGYHAFYNPGGPGPEPFEGVRYTAAGPPDLEPVLVALDDPMRVDREAD